MKKKKKKVQGEVAGQSRLGKYPFLSRDVVALFRAARIACTGEYGPFEELSFGGLDRWVRICKTYHNPLQPFVRSDAPALSDGVLYLEFQVPQSIYPADCR